MTIYEVLKYYENNGAEAGRNLKVSRKTIAAWKVRGIPICRQYQIELVTRGKLKADKQ